MKALYIKTPINTILNVTKIVTIHYFEFDKNFSFEGEKHDFWELVYVDKGKVKIKRDNESVILKQGELIFHRPNEFHAIKAYESAPSFFVISFLCNSPAMKHFEKYHTALDKTLKPFISSIISESESTFITHKNNTKLKKLEKIHTPIIGGEQLIKTYLEQLLIFLTRDILQVKKAQIFPNKESLESHLVTSIKNYIENNVHSNVKLSDLCKEFGYSKSYLCKIFHNQTGSSICDYGIKVKIKTAKQLIRENNYNFSQISDLLSFDNPQYFSRVFKRVTGITPTEFSQSLKISN